MAAGLTGGRGGGGEEGLPRPFFFARIVGEFGLSE